MSRGILQEMEDNIFPMPLFFDVKIQPLIGAYFYNELIKSIDEAKLHIKSVQYQWKWNVHQRHSKVQQLGNAIERAQKRHIDINVVLNQESPLRNISKINMVTNNQLSNIGCNVKLLRTPSLLHTKLWIIDGQYTFIGSHNISGRSLTVNEEVSVKITSVQFAVFMTRYFINLWEAR